MKYNDPKMEKYWKGLPSDARALISHAGIEITSLGMLEKLGEYYRNDSSLDALRAGDTRQDYNSIS